MDNLVKPSNKFLKCASEQEKQILSIVFLKMCPLLLTKLFACIDNRLTLYKQLLTIACLITGQKNHPPL